MKTLTSLRASILLLVLVCLPVVVSRAVRAGGGTTIKGWISDESCARGRASSGLFTGTNPECAKKCIASGVKMVLIIPDQRRLLTVANPDAAKANIGDFVEISGSVEATTKTVHIDSLKLLTKGVAMCGLPAKK